MKLITTMLCVTFLALVAGCAGEDPEANVWEDQTDAIEQARDVEATLERASAATRDAITGQAD